MSVHVTSIIWRHYPSRTELLTALALADIADDRGFCIYADTSIEAIAGKTLQSPRSVQYHLQAMKQIGWLVVVGNKDGGRGQATQYRIPVELVPLGGVAQRVQDLRPLENRQSEATVATQDVVVSGQERAQELHPSALGDEKGANSAVKGAIHDTKGCKTQQSLYRGTSVHKSTGAAASRATSLPPDFSISENVRAWAKKKGFEQYLEAHFEWFVDYAKARPAKVSYADWDAALRNCITSDWGDIRKNWKSRPVQQQQQQARTCTYRTDRTGGVCGMPAIERFGGDDLCAHHKEKLQNAGPMPAEARAKLDEFLRRGGRKSAGSEVPA